MVKELCLAPANFILHGTWGCSHTANVSDPCSYSECPWNTRVHTFEEGGRSWREKYLKECDLWEEVVKANGELAGEWAALLVDRDNLKEKFEESEADRKRLKDGIVAVSQLLTEAMAKVRVKCRRCQRFLDKSGRCAHCAGARA
jgi:hypothetical protein